MILEGCATNYRGEKVYEDEKCRVESKVEFMFGRRVGGSASGSKLQLART